MPLSVGPHSLALRQNGVEVWRQQLTAQANIDHEFNPSMTEDKQRERRARASQQPPPPPPRREESPPVEEPKTVVDETPVVPPIVEVPKPPPPPVELPKPPPPTITQPPPPKPPVVIQRTGPMTVAPTAVTRISGDTPSVGMSKRAEVPSVIAAKVCINPQGAVTSVDILTKLERHTSSDLAATMRSWRYAPYKHNGTAIAACFVVSFRVK
jgi:hypothetical protein